jgi:hypothetical protein
VTKTSAAWNQRRVDAFTNIVRDPRILRETPGDSTLDNLRGFGRNEGVADKRLNTGSSCIGCHVDGMNRANDNLRDWLDSDQARLPKGEFGADAWLNDPATVKRVRELNPPSSEMRPGIEDDRRVFLTAMAQIWGAAISGAARAARAQAIGGKETGRVRSPLPCTSKHGRRSDAAGAAGEAAAQSSKDTRRARSIARAVLDRAQKATDTPNT